MTPPDDDTELLELHLDRRVDRLETNHAVLAQAVARIGGEARELHGRAAILKDEMSDLRATVMRMEDRMTDVRAGMLGLNENVTKLSDRMGALIEKIGTLDRDWRKLALAVLAPALAAIALGLWTLLTP